LAAILAADMVGYSRLIEQDEAGTVARLKTAREELIDPTIGSHGGRIVRLAGDGALVEFPSVVEAVQCAIEIQRGMELRNAESVDQEPMLFRVGVNLGDILVEDDNLHGDGINVAARLESIADPGEILVSEEVVRHVDGKVDATIRFVEERSVKNIARPVRVWRVAIDGDTTPTKKGLARVVGRPARTLLTAAGVASVAAVGWILSMQPSLLPAGKTDGQEPLAGRDERASLVVMPFENLSADQEQEYFADGITDDLITDLSQISGLFVIARHTAFVYKGRQVSVKRVGEELGVRYVLEGSVRRAGDRVRINSQLIDSSTGGSLWAERYDRDFADIFEIQDDVAGRIVAALSLHLTRTERERLTLRYTVSPEAYDFFLQGQEYYLRLTAESNQRARELYRLAIEEDPNFARAYGALSITFARDAYYGWSVDPERALDEALPLARKAVALGEAIPQSHWALGFVRLFRREHDLAIAATERSLAIDPNYADGYGLLAWIHTFAGQPKRAIELLDKAFVLNPHPTGIFLQVLGQAQYWAGSVDEALVTNKKVVAINPNLIDGRLYLAACYASLGRADDAQWEAEEILMLAPDFALSDWSRRDPIGDPGSLDRLLTDLRLAGLK
jgi:adenylate cyclase